MSDPPATPRPRRSHRGEGRHDYRHFPSAYTELVEQFERTGEARLGPFTKREADANRYRINRFFGFLRNADPSDEYARQLYRIAGTMVSRLEYVSASGPPSEGDQCWLVWYLDPVVKLMQQPASPVAEPIHPVAPQEPHSEKE